MPTLSSTSSTESAPPATRPEAGPAPAGSPASCSSCGAPLAGDQRYCLECGERRAPMSSVLLGDTPLGGRSGPDAAVAPPVPPRPPGGAPGGGRGSRNATLNVIAGVGVLLLAMGVGVLIGRSGAPRQSSAPAQVITVAAGGGSATPAGTAPEAAFAGDWPAATSGYTVQLQTLPAQGTTAAAVQVAKSADSAQGASAVGALKSEEFSSLTAGSYVIYSGIYHGRAEAQKALAGLRKSFPGASVIRVSNSSSSAAGEGASTSSSGSGSGSGANINHPAPASVLEGLKGAKGKSYEEKSKNLPNVVSTG